MERTTKKVKVEKKVVEEEVTVVTVSQDDIQKAMGKAVARIARALEDPTIIFSGAMLTVEVIDYLFHNDEEKED